MDNQEPRKSSYWKFVGAFIGIILVVAVGFIAWKSYEIMHDRQVIKDVADAMKQAEVDALQRAMADTYGGKTPQETLAMYIDAVEKGDYELASKYFIGDYQARQMNDLTGIARANKIETFLSPLRLAQKSLGEYSKNKDTFSIHEPVLISFGVYPSGIWKIIEI